MTPVDEAVERVKAYVEAWGPVDFRIDTQGPDHRPLNLSDLRALLSALELGRQAQQTPAGLGLHPSALQEPSAVREAYREGWYVNAAVGDQPADYLAGCEDVDWRESKAALSASTTDSGKGRLDAEAGGWRPIESAPRDSESILLGWAGGPCVEIGYWHCGRFVWDSAFETGTIDEQPTHWRPLPAPPTGEGGHASDCALHNAPALPVGTCDCGAGGVKL